MQGRKIAKVFFFDFIREKYEVITWFRSGFLKEVISKGGLVDSLLMLTEKSVAAYF